MATLSPDQIAFLYSHMIPRSKVFDATGLSRQQYQVHMKELDLYFAFGVTPCRVDKHELRSRPGHCIVCDTKNIAFMKRHYSDGHVYVAHSPMSGYVKIGTTGDAAERIYNINRTGYAGATDWALKFSCKVLKAGEIEWLAQKGVEHTQIFPSYIKDGFENVCQEVFVCSVDEAIQSLKNAISS